MQHPFCILYYILNHVHIKSIYINEPFVDPMIAKSDDIIDLVTFLMLVITTPCLNDIVRVQLSSEKHDETFDVVPWQLECPLESVIGTPLKVPLRAPFKTKQAPFKTNTNKKNSPPSYNIQSKHPMFFYICCVQMWMFTTISYANHVPIIDQQQSYHLNTNRKTRNHYMSSIRMKTKRLDRFQ